MAHRFLLIRSAGYNWTPPLRFLTRTRSSAAGAAPFLDVDGIKVEKAGRCMVIRMERGENRLNREFLRSMNQVLDAAESCHDATAMVTIGKDKHFSLGLDLQELDNLTDADRINFFNDFERLLCRTLTFPLVTVAAVNGHVFAAGALFALVQDCRVMRTERGWFCLPEVNIKRRFSVGMYEILKATLPQPTLHKAAVLGRRYTAEEAKEAGIVDEVCPMSKLEETALSAAMRLAGKDGLDRGILSSIKQDLYRDTCTILNESVQFYSDYN